MTRATHFFMLVSFHAGRVDCGRLGDIRHGENNERSYVRVRFRHVQTLSCQSGTCPSRDRAADTVDACSSRLRASLLSTAHGLHITSLVRRNGARSRIFEGTFPDTEGPLLFWRNSQKVPSHFGGMTESQKMCQETQVSTHGILARASMWLSSVFDSPEIELRVRAARALAQ